MIQLPKYLIAYNKRDMPDHTLVISTQAPYLVGKVWMWKDTGQFLTWCANYRGLGMSAVPGYNIAVAMETTLTGPQLRTSVNPANLIASSMEEMAMFYLDERISVKKGYYKKYMMR